MQQLLKRVPSPTMGFHLLASVRARLGLDLLSSSQGHLKKKEPS